MSNPNFSIASETFTRDELLYRRLQTFAENTAAITIGTEAEAREAIESMAGTNTTAAAERDGLSVTAMPLGVHALVLGDGRAASVALLHQRQGENNRPLEKTQLALRLGNRGLFYHRLADNGVACDVGLTIFEDVSSPNQIPADHRALGGLCVALFDARATGNYGKPYRGGRTLPPVQTDVSVVAREDTTITVARRVSDGGGRRDGFRAADTEALYAAMRTMDSMEGDVIDRITAEARFRREHPLLARLLYKR